MEEAAKEGNYNDSFYDKQPTSHHQIKFTNVKPSTKSVGCTFITHQNNSAASVLHGFSSSPLLSAEAKWIVSKNKIMFYSFPYLP